MKGIVSPPVTYQEWLCCFDYIKVNGLDGDSVKLLAQGSLQCDAQMLSRFENQLVSLLNVWLDKKTKSFTKKLNRLLECNETEDLTLLFGRFKRELDPCLFFVKLEFLPQDIKLRLSASVTEQVRKFLQEVLGHLRLQAAESGNPPLEDALYRIRRIYEQL